MYCKHVLFHNNFASKYLCKFYAPQNVSVLFHHSGFSLKCKIAMVTVKKHFY